MSGQLVRQRERDDCIERVRRGWEAWSSLAVRNADTMGVRSMLPSAIGIKCRSAVGLYSISFFLLQL